MAKTDDWLKKVEKELEKAKKEGHVSETVAKLVSELRIHQAELEMQNEELRQSQEEYAELYSQYSDLYNDVPVGYFTLDKGGIIGNVNVKGAELLQLDKKKIIGRGFSRFILKAEEWKYYHALANCIDTGKNQELELQLKRDETSFDTHMEIMPIFDKKGSRYRIIINDITGRKRAEETLKGSEEKYRTLFNFIDEGYCIIDVIFDKNNKPIDYRFLEINSAFERQTGLIDAEGKLMRELRPNHEEHWFEIYGEIALTGNPMRFQNPAKELNRFYDVYAFKIGGKESKKVAILFNDISERIKVEKALRKSEEQFSAFVKSSSDVVYRMSPDWSEMRQLRGRKFLPDTYSPSETWRDKYIHPDDQPHVQEVINEAIQSKGIFELEHRVLQVDGTLGWTYSRAVPMLDENGEIIEWFGTAKDITEQKKAEEELRRSEKKYRSIGELIPFGVWTTDAQGQATYISQSFCDLVGRTEKDIIKFGWIDTLHPDDRERTLNDWRKNVDEAGFWDYTHHVMGVDGKYHYVLARGTPIKDENGEITGWVGVNIDITGQKKLETELKKSRDNLELKVQGRTTELNVLVDELKRSNEELQQFAYVSSHDLQEPLRTIASFTQLLERRYKGKFDSDADEFMDFIVEAAVRMKGQIEGLLEYSRVGTKGGEFQIVDMNEILKQTIQSLRISIEEAEAEITVDELPNIMGDAGQLQRVFLNLISNAIRFRKCEEQLKVHISANKDIYNKEYVFSVNDNGIGIEEQYSERIFTIFQRLHTRDVYKGTGIGLSIVKRIIERHGGRIWVESEFDVGSTFYFTIPVEPVHMGGGQFLK